MESKYESRVTSHEPSPLTKGLGESRIRAGSALILVVVLTSLLAIVGVMFVMVARVDRIATSAISENKTLDYAVEAVIARISQVLVSDVPGVGGQPDYYDYPDGENAWLASLEPYEYSLNNYRWRQISDVTGYIGPAAQRNVDVEIVKDHEEIELDSSGDIESSPEQLADADGDGVADSKWIELEGINSSKGKTIFAAVRVIDNGGMLNVNTAYKFDPTGDRERIDGSSQTQINLEALARVGDTIDEIEDARNPDDKPLLDYQDELIWRIEDPCSDYLPFDISDELELRNRFFLTTLAKTRLEDTWFSTIGHSNFKRVPYDGQGVYDEDHWWRAINQDANQPDRRHFLTTYNMDRIINPYGGKMVNVNRASAGLIYSAIKLALFTADPNFKDIDEIAAQTAVNLIDFRDENSDVTPLPDVNGITYYGFERPCVYISEVVHKFEIPPAPGGPIGPGGEPVIYRSYAIELYKPYSEDSDPDNWQLVISGPPPPGGPIGAPVGRPRKEECDIDWSGSKQFYVIRNDPHKILPEIDSDAVVEDSGALVFSKGDLIELQRRVDDVNITVDSIEVTGWLVPDPPVVGTRSFKRDINLHKCIRRLWADVGEEALTLGRDNSYTDPSDGMIQAHPENRPFTNIGEIGMVFRRSAYGEIKPSDTEADVRINLADPNYHGIFKYLTVFDPSKDGINNDGDGETPSDPDGWIDDEDEPYLTPEWKIPGRININTAPWYVIAQLPWVSDKLAQAIIAYRDKLKTPVDYSDPNVGNTGRYDVIKNKIPSWVDQDNIREELGFASIGELAFVLSGGKDEYNEYSIDRLSKDGNDLEDFPDLTPSDKAEDDFEERDVIFARISNLVTVRSDVFTAYMLVRIGADGPQKRIMAILDRSNVYTDDGRVQIVALHAVADPR